VRISYQISREDFIEAQKLHCSRSPAAWLQVIGLIGKWLSIVIFGSALVWVLLDPTIWPNLRPLILLVGFWMLFVWVWIPFNWRRIYARDRKLRVEIFADISEEGIQLHTESADSQAKWSNYIRLLESEKVFLLYISKRLFNIFPKRAFGSGEVDQFRELSRKHVASK
jgi:YcxB-like protein